MTTFKALFRKTVWGEILIEAKDKLEAIDKFNSDDYDELDNDTEYAYQKEIVRKEGNCTFVEASEDLPIDDAIFKDGE